MVAEKIHPTPGNYGCYSHRAMDVIKDLEKRESSGLSRWAINADPIYPYNRETEGVWRQQRKRPCDQEAGVGNDAPAARMLIATRSSWRQKTDPSLDLRRKRALPTT